LAGEFIRDSHLDGPILNNLNIGGYLIYHLFPKLRVYVDSRPEAYAATFAREKYTRPLENENQWKQLSEEYRFNVICFKASTPSENRFVLRRVADPAWAPVFYDGRIFVLVRRTAANLDFLRTHEIQKVPSVNRGGSR